MTASKANCIALVVFKTWLQCSYLVLHLKHRTIGCFYLSILQTEDLIKALQDLENAASGDATVRQKIASLPQEVQDVSLLEKITGKKIECSNHQVLAGYISYAFGVLVLKFLMVYR